MYQKIREKGLLYTIGYIRKITYISLNLHSSNSKRNIGERKEEVKEFNHVTSYISSKFFNK